MIEINFKTCGLHEHEDADEDEEEGNLLTNISIKKTTKKRPRLVGKIKIQGKLREEDGEM